MSPSSRRTAAVELQSQFAVSERRACAVLGQPRTTQRYRGRPRSDEAALCCRLRELVRRRPLFGNRRLAAVLRREGRRQVLAGPQHRLSIPQLLHDLLGTVPLPSLRRHRVSPRPSWAAETLIPRGSENGEQAKGRLEIETWAIVPDRPWENGYAESFHSKLIDEFLSWETFESVVSTRQLTAAWKDDDNHHRPHSELTQPELS